MTLNASAVISGSGQPIATSVPAELPQCEFSDALEHYLAGTWRQDVGVESTATNPKATLTQRCKTLTALIHRRLAEGDNVLDDDELQHLQALQAQLALQQWPDDIDPGLAKLGIAPVPERDQHNSAGLAMNESRAETGGPTKTLSRPGVWSAVAPSSLTVVSPEFTDTQGEGVWSNKDQQPLVLVPSTKRNARRTENIPLRLGNVNLQKLAAHPLARGEAPLRIATPAGKFATTAMHTPSTGLEVITTDTPSQGTAAPPPAPIVHLRQPLGSLTWQQKLGEHITLFNRNGVFHAHLHLHPRELGAVKINLRLNKEQLQVHFASDNQQVRAVLETAMTQLRISLAENGITLGDTSVCTEESSHDTSGHQQGRGANPQHGQGKGKSLFMAHRNGGMSADLGAWYHDGIDIYA
ncbi:flagellar hook-length control protein FliK [Sodalis-like endosymbiont of Proechinophthirus fluctus]|uniref:flagellar hook-length control protein FliK n=1 Tax=Sodalis-like endosymbiont of Proechinophthirus fluctus TaxID=1462730 RepID=UPI00082F828E|nr:flagellar hook-length control protein FliK [Sodalis-like endosymbiont of Proechinophthirus fluctus]